jgi:hypothetical protein
MAFLPLFFCGICIYNLVEFMYPGKDYPKVFIVRCFLLLQGLFENVNELKTTKEKSRENSR